jgi:hypothetical protein
LLEQTNQEENKGRNKSAAGEKIKILIAEKAEPPGIQDVIHALT